MSVGHFPQALRQHGARNQRHGKQQVTEGAWPEAQLAHDERRPAIGQDLGCLGDRAELSVAQHRGLPDLFRARE
jgi:hypothetical protein